jgi:hypothetical protein
MSSDNTAAEKPKGNKPVDELFDGKLKVTIWKKDGKHRPFYQTTWRNSYKDEATGEWKDTDSLGEDDLLPLRELLGDAYAWIKQQKRADAKARKDAEQAA